ncbi:DUF2062 domain-containing protein [Halovenus halobia]|uniref:DUF2062 domain-containing protein n=1 Tax=Halovenus halobia TaxID=3396622 RepID=UPI003F568E4A
MELTRFGGHLQRMQRRLRGALAEDHPPRVVARYFAAGIFLTTLPSFGLILPVLTWVGARFDRANRLSLLAAMAIMNPLAKGTVYVGSFLLGVQLLGPVAGSSAAEIGFDAGRVVITRLLVGNLVLAVVFGAVAYLLAYQTALEYDRRHG